MMDHRPVSLQEARTLARDLHGLRDVAAPPTLAPGVLARVGIADSYFPLDTPIGPVYVAYNGRGISAVMRSADGPDFERAFSHQFGRPVYPALEAPISLRRSLAMHLEGTKRDLRFDLRGLTEFERAVLTKALEIPRGEIRPYAWIAREIGRPRAVRAVGTALANNPIPLFIPCHRVVRSDGIIGNYGLGGPSNKRALLEWEGVNPEEIADLARHSARYVGSDTTGIYCFPTCRHARRVSSQHRQMFRSEAEATAAGYRPCKVCRPGPVAVGE